MIPQRAVLNSALGNDELEIKGYKKDRLFLLISNVYEATINKAADGLTGVDYSFGAVVLKELIGNNYREYADYLVDRGIITIDESYVAGEYCMNYSISPSYITKPDWYTVTQYPIKKAIRRNEMRRKSKKSYPHLEKWFDGLRMDTENAEKFIELYYSVKKEHPELRDYNAIEEAYKNPDCQEIHAVNNVANYKMGNYLFKVDKSGRRMHTQLTATNKLLRNFLTYNDQPLVSIDLKNSQPFLLMAVLDKDRWVKKSKKYFSFYINNNKITNNILITMWTKYDETQYSKEFTAYKNLAASGDLYEFFMRRIHLTEDIKNTLSLRDYVKTKIMHSFFSPNRTNCGEVKRILGSEFPFVTKLMVDIKRRDYVQFSLLLQRIESYLILDIICKRISKERPDLPIFTIHDSIVTTDGNQDYISSIIKDEMMMHIGGEPKLSIEHLDPQKSWNSLYNLQTRVQRQAA